MSFFSNCNCGCGNRGNNCCEQRPCCRPCGSFNNCGCNEPFFCPRVNAFVVRGPRGATGPQGPQGPQGLPGSIAQGFGSFASPVTESVAAGADLPLATNVALSGTSIQHVAGQSAVTLAAGTYYIAWKADATIPAGGTAGLALAVNGVVNTNSQSTATGTAANVATLSGNTILTVPAQSTITLRNSGTETTSYRNVAMSVIKLA